MYFIRFLAIVILTLSVSLSSAIDAGHAPTVDHDHAAAEVMADEQHVCCQESTESTQTCHALPALIPATELASTAPVTGENVFCASHILLTGIEPSGPLDPPRKV